MGTCASVPAEATIANHKRPLVQPSAASTGATPGCGKQAAAGRRPLATVSTSSSISLADTDEGGDDQGAPRPRRCGQQQRGLMEGSSAARALDLIKRVHDMQERLALASGGPLLGLPDAVDMIADQLGADLVAVWIVCSEDPRCSVLMASSGAGAGALERRVWRAAGGAGSCAEGGGAALGAPRALAVADASADEGVPADVAALWQLTGLRSVLQLPLGAPASPIGTLLLAKHEPRGFEEDEWQVWSQAAAMGVLQHARHAQVQLVTNLLHRMHEAGSPAALVSLLLQGARQYILRATSVRPAVRLALLQRGSTDALLFELPRGAGASAARPSPLGAAAGASAPLASVRGAPDERMPVTVSSMSLAGTLLGSAISERQARFVKDCSRYMQSCPKMARDVFGRNSELVSSVVVVPLVVDGAPIGGLYFALDSPCSFEGMQDALLGLVHSVGATLASKVVPHLDDLMAEAMGRSMSGPLRLGSSQHLAGLEGSPSSGSLTSNSAGPGAAAALGRPSSQLSATGASHRLNTEAMLQVLQREVRSSWRRGAEMRHLRELALAECIGQGGFGAVYRGTWHKAAAAIKVMNARKSEHEAMKDAVEMAVLSSAQHPNIVQVYACLTDMVEVTDDLSSVGSASTAECLRLRYRRLLPSEETDEAVATVNLLVMEFCDRGTLRQAVQAGAFHRALVGGAVGVDILAAVEVLLEVAHAVQYLHSLQLVHGDIKMDNILFKSDASSPRGVICKLADFGLSKILNEAETAVNLDGAGTVTHLAPEMFQAGPHVTRAVDAYAFGVCMYELYTRRAAYEGMPHAAVVERVRRGARPAFPAGAPRGYAALAEACWAADPAARPAFAEIAEALEAVAADILRPLPPRA